MIKENFICTIETTAAAQSAKVTPGIDQVLIREKTDVVQQTPAVTPVLEETKTLDGDYIFPESDSRYLTDDDLSGYSSDQLELAKNEI